MNPKAMKRTLFSILLAAVGVVSSNNLVNSESITVKEPNTIRVVDGDTIIIGGEGRFRLACIDAPEMKQGDSGVASKVKLEELIDEFGIVETRALSNAADAPDKYNRQIVELISDGGLNLNVEMVRSGQAVVYWDYFKNCPNKDQYLDALQEAQADGREIWSEENPVMPWEFRRRKK